ncbi:MAG: energy-coupling factor ABC transporter permease, partial [Armatimonadetes bacterium]|nr:energy-coupling factor ABC transporter permease [Armatimonadota bacterium]
MHIPDGFLSPQVWMPLAVGSGLAVVYAARRAEREVPPEKVPLVGATAAFIFAAQMVNFRVSGGFSGHLIGGVLAAALLGPNAALVAMTVVLLVQALLFQDGGVTALGANVLNMAVIATWVGWPLARVLAARIATPNGRAAAVGFGAAVAVLLGAVACALELSASGTIPLRPHGVPLYKSIPLLFVAVHVPVAAAEGILTAGALTIMYRWRPD